MAPGTARAIRNTLLLLAVAILVVNILSMTGRFRRFADPVTLNVLGVVFVMVAGSLRKSARARPSPPA